MPVKMNFQYHLPTKIIFGRGKLSQLSELLMDYGEKGDTALIVSGKSTARRYGFLDKVDGYFRDAGWRTIIFDKVSPNPKSDELNEAIKTIKGKDGKINCNLIVGLGGGSAIDAAKAIKVGVHYDFVEKIIGKTVNLDYPNPIPVIAIPTTAGSGAEVTKGAIIIDTRRNLKSGIRGEVLFPEVALVDPELTLTLPPKVTAETGFDALTHAIESYVAKKANAITDQYSEKAIKLIADNLERAVNHGQDIDAREKMSLASLLGGINIANASSCLPHRLQQAFGSIIDSSHGAGLAAVYPAWLRCAYPYAKEKFNRIATIFGDDNCEEAIVNFIKKIGVDYRLDDFGAQKSQIYQFVGKVEGNLTNDPMPSELIEKKGKYLIRKIYEESF